MGLQDQKPAGCPLTLTKTGHWCKKIKGEVVYFGRDLATALERYRERHCTERRIAGQGGVTLRYAINAFLTFKKSQVTQGLLSPVSYQDYESSAKRFREHLDLDRPLTSYGPDDFQLLFTRLAEPREKQGNGRVIKLGRGPIALNGDVRRLRVMLKYAYEERLIDRPVWGGQALKLLPKRVLRKLRKEKLFTAEEILKLLAAADQTLKAMILLGINAGLTPVDVGCFPQSAIDASTGKVYFPRAKTEVKRHFFLWPETLDAIHAAGGLPFKTRRGVPWSQSQIKDRSLSKKMGKLMALVGVGRDRRNFYTLRHTFQTVADAAPHSKAHVVKYIMGHSDSSMSETYRELIDDAQLRYVTDHVRTWLFGPARLSVQSSGPTPELGRP